MTSSAEYEACEKFIDWLSVAVRNDAIGIGELCSENNPIGKFWLGRLAPETEIRHSDLGMRAERLEPCAVGMRVMLEKTSTVFALNGAARFSVWRKCSGYWEKTGPLEIPFNIDVRPETEGRTRVTGIFDKTLDEISPDDCLKAAIDIEIKPISDGRHEATITLVNISDPDHAAAKKYSRARLFECELSLFDLKTTPFLLESLPDSFRYDRRVAAWGINCGIEQSGPNFKTIDLPAFEKPRPVFWNVEDREPDFRFKTLADDPFPSLDALYSAHGAWGKQAWDIENLKSDTVDWNEELTTEAILERELFFVENTRLAAGIELLRNDGRLLTAFKFMNEAMSLSAHGRYDAWRPFQVGFLISNLDSCISKNADIVDIVWFPTGGGKTETYLGLILTAAFHDRLRGKTTGITAWSRFPLRLLSLQQTQRFANALAAAETVRRNEAIVGDPFGLGFLVGNGSTPNKIDPGKGNRGQWDYEDPSMPEKLRMLKECPFCRRPDVEMKFNRRYWRLEHKCGNQACIWESGEPLPIWIVDADIWRFLPTVVVGTLDKAAGIGMQTNMRGMLAAPLGMCSEMNHGHTYAPRYGRPNGCLVPDCEAKRQELPMDPSLYGTAFRLQDELHLLRDSLGAIDAHYEAVLDDLQLNLSGSVPKILASSATLSGYERQNRILYRRAARVFPHPEPKVGRGFWVGGTKRKMRRFLAVAPRGQTIEYAVDRMIVSLQSAIRRLIDAPTELAAEIGIDEKLIPFLIDLYGTDVVYGNTLRDLDAINRSAQTQWGDITDPPPRLASLTGGTAFKEVSEILENLEGPPVEFSDRIHVVTASSMMSHGVDIDRLNVMVMLGLPLTTAEFIQSTARVGRKWPSIVFVVHKVARERDASIYRAFPQYVDQGDRFVEPIPITGRSRRVLERTMPGLAFSRILMLHEQFANLTVWKAYGLREYIASHPEFQQKEAEAICDMLGYGDAQTAQLKSDVDEWYGHFVRNVNDPANSGEWSNTLGHPPNGPMRSLRDVEEPVPVWGQDPS